jgi:phage terminase large subunit GpA-like protein
VKAIIGRRDPIKGSVLREFSPGKGAGGHDVFNIATVLYKDRFTAWTKAEWKEGSYQPTGYLNYPEDFRDSFFDQLVAEAKFRVKHSVTKRTLGWEWRQIGQRPNHALDCTVYGMCAFDQLVLGVCLDLGMEVLSYPHFFAHMTPRKNAAGKWLQTAYSVHPEEVLR